MNQTMGTNQKVEATWACALEMLENCKGGDIGGGDIRYWVLYAEKTEPSFYNITLFIGDDMCELSYTYNKGHCYYFRYTHRFDYDAEKKMFCGLRCLCKGPIESRKGKKKFFDTLLKTCKKTGVCQYGYFNKK